MRAVALRWLKFNTVGAIGIGVQLAVLAVLKSGLGLHYLLATTLAVEAAVLHNFAWHTRWTWGDRPAAGGELVRRLVRFHVANGAVSLASNLVWMRLLVGALGMPYLAANGIAIAATSILNFVLGEKVVFRKAAPRGARSDRAERR